MKILKLNIFFGLLLVFSFQASTVFACHEGGSMGFASEDPLASTTDYSSGSTFIFASTFGTLGCKNWDFVKNNRVQYLDIAWNKLSEEVAQGKGLWHYHKCMVAKENINRPLNHCCMETTLVFSWIWSQ